ncbi:MAG: hypothetical protein CMJ83_16265 [Planctomycetes bacterium]|nr:hypothetical protein [Planctomycetota bacterium]
MVRWLALGTIATCIVAAPVTAQAPAITEFMARNASSLVDEDGDYSDWIEIHNPADAPVSLVGWSLTDDPSIPGKWAFPAETLAAKGYLVVFASNKDRATVGAPLHTNFRLNGEGETLQLVGPGGVVQSAWSFSEQRADWSFGRAEITETLLGEGAAAYASVPTNGAAGLTWTNPPSIPNWTFGPTGVGYDTTGGYGPYIQFDVGPMLFAQNASIHIVSPVYRKPDTLAWSSLRLLLRYDDGFVAYLNGVEVARANAPATPQWNSAATGPRPNAEAVLYETFDLSPFFASLLRGQNWLAIHGLNVAPADSDLLISPKLELGRYDTEVAFFETGTPGAANGGGVPAFAAAPIVTPGRAISSARFIATVTSATPGAQIWYTTDGSLPSPQNGALYLNGISVSQTTVLRCVALAEELGPSTTTTTSWVFPNIVVNQPASPAGLPSTWGTHTQPNGQPFVAIADYGMDPSVATDAQIAGSLRSLPSLCINMAPDDLFGSSNGLYANPEQDWERAASAELVYPDGRPGFQIDCGVQNHGGGSRLPWLTPKHSFRLKFRGQYGESQLRFPLFGNTAEELETLVLKGGFNDAWTIAAPSHCIATYCRDAYTRALQREMGHASCRDTHVHLYLNGLYWGLYQAMERPDAKFMTNHLGGNKDDWDILKHRYAEIVNGDANAWNTMYGIAAPWTNSWTQIQDWIDVENFTDYFFLNFYLATGDWMPNNWYCARRREPDAGFQFFCWDAELAIKSEDRTGLDVPDTPAYIYARLKTNPEFRTLFGDRAHKWMFNGGLLEPANAQARLRLQAARVAPALVAESARWGDWMGNATLTPASKWEPAIEYHRNILGTRRDDVVTILRNAGLYPTVEAPTFSQFGGAIGVGFTLTITQPGAGTVYYTLEGSDPRVEGGATLNSAQTYSSPIPLTGPSVTVKARVKEGANWSALVEATFQFETVVINEFLASNQNGIVDEAGEAEDWIEIFNPTGVAHDLSGWWLTDDLADPSQWQIPAGTMLMPGERLIVWADDEPQQGVLHATFKLRAAGEDVGLFAPDGVSMVDSITFGAQITDISCGRLADGGDQWVTFPIPSPLLANAASAGCGAFPYRGLVPSSYTMRLEVSGQLQTGTSMTLTTIAGPPSVNHTVLLSTSPAEQPVTGSPASLLLGSPLEFYVMPANVFGSTSMTFALPTVAGLAGQPIYLQAAATAINGSLVGSNGVIVTLCP